MSPDRTHDISNTPYHVKDIKAFGDVLERASNAAFPNRNTAFPNRRMPRYKEVHVLLLSWEGDNLGVIEEVIELEGLFRNTYHFETEGWRIPSKRSHNSLAAKILGFLDDYESKDNLLVVYYGGHGEMNDDRQCVWLCTGQEDSPEVQWYGLQTMLEQAKSDVLILLDCCAAASSATGSGNGITEIIAACGFEAWAPGVGQHSFTRSLIDELRYLHGTAPFSTSLLHNKVLSRVKYWKPRFDPSGSHREMRKTPIYIVLSNESRPRSIELEPQQRSTGSIPRRTSSDSLSSDSILSSLSIEQAGPSRPATKSTNSSMSDVWPDSHFECPKVLISVALEEEQWLSAQQWADWLRSIPALVKHANIEGVYKSDSTLMLISIPIAVWNLIPSEPAISFVGFSRSKDLLKSNITENNGMSETETDPAIDDVDMAEMKELINNRSDEPWTMSAKARSYDISGGITMNAQQQSSSNILPPHPTSDWERSTASASLYDRFALKSSTGESLSSAPSSITTTHEVNLPKTPLGPGGLEHDTKPVQTSEQMLVASPHSSINPTYWEVEASRKETIAVAYGQVRESMWKLLASRIGESWEYVEDICMKEDLLDRVFYEEKA